MRTPDMNTIMIVVVSVIGAWNAYQQSMIKRDIAELKVWMYQNFVPKAFREPAE